MKKFTQLEYSVWLLVLRPGLIIIRVRAICTSVRFFTACWLRWNSVMLQYVIFLKSLIVQQSAYWFPLFWMSCRCANKQWVSLHKQLTFVQIKNYTIFRFVSFQFKLFVRDLSYSIVSTLHYACSSQFRSYRFSFLVILDYMLLMNISSCPLWCVHNFVCTSQFLKFSSYPFFADWYTKEIVIQIFIFFLFFSVFNLQK